ncbi:complex I assembly factor ACAD9, mitochondrial [Lasioglossum baleicum]|uniref:complex I assembly factor ACAD9, mitochondrial n=1 Tax=Lasioglossum baleicum TaxID=434251 RepID=UPI003FCD7FBB
MFTRQQLKIKKLFPTKLCDVTKRNVQTVAQSQVSKPNKYYFSECREKEPAREPFLKNLAVGNIDKEIFSLAEVQPIQRFKDFETWLMPIDNYIFNRSESKEKVDRNAVLSCLKDLEIFRAYGSETYKGLNLSETESLRLIETVSTLPWLGTHLVKNNMLPVQLILKYGSDSQKQKYLPKIMSGECIPAICLKEDNNATNINHLKTVAIPYDENSMELNGDKVFVFNGTNANLFLVFAQNSIGNVIDINALSLYLVERDYPGISFTDTYQTIGRHEIPVCSMNFTHTIVPNENVIGEPKKAFSIMMDLLKPGNQIIAAQSIAILRNFLKNMTTDVLKMKHFDRDLHGFDSVKKILAEGSCTLYTMESMAYLTSKLADLYENQDVEVERIVTEVYCANKCLSTIQSGLQVLGAQTYMNNSHYTDMYHNALALTTLDMNNIDAQLYVGTATLKHAGKVTAEEIFKLRNPAGYPVNALTRSYRKMFVKKPMLMGYLHATLDPGLYYLQESIYQTQFNVERLLTLHGTDITNKYLELLRMNDMITEMYATFANLSRASRSYSIGLRNSDLEKDMVVCLAHNSLNIVSRLTKEIEDNDILNGDVYYKNIADAMYSQRMYPIEHPLHRTFT